MMNVLILTLGSRADVQPYVALGQGLKRAGHAVTVCTSARFESFVAEHGLNYGYMNGELMRLMNSDEFRDVLAAMATFSGDQPFWGRRAWALGVGSKPRFRSGS